MMEASSHCESAFVTLTYAEEKLPVGNNLIPQHFTNFMKRLREKISPVRIRYFAVGEYSDAPLLRPHYHCMLFGFQTCLYGRSRYSKLRARCCARCDLVADTWGHGHIFLGEVEQSSAAYCARYVVKKMTSMDDPRLKGRYPEFARMSLKPGLGYYALEEIVKVFEEMDALQPQADVPNSVRRGGVKHPLGRYLTHQLRKVNGRDEKAPEWTRAQQAARLYDMWESARAVTAEPGMARFRKEVFRDAILKASEGKRIQMEARYKLRNVRGSL